MKKIFVLIISAILILSTVACSEVLGGEGESDIGTPFVVRPEDKIGVRYSVSGFSDFCKFLNVELTPLPSACRIRVCERQTTETNKICYVSFGINQTSDTDGRLEISVSKSGEAGSESSVEYSEAESMYKAKWTAISPVTGSNSTIPVYYEMSVYKEDISEEDFKALVGEYISSQQEQ